MRSRMEMSEPGARTLSSSSTSSTSWDWVSARRAAAPHSEPSGPRPSTGAAPEMRRRSRSGSQVHSATWPAPMASNTSAASQPKRACSAWGRVSVMPGPHR
jgi:hypothetical protein